MYCRFLALLSSQIADMQEAQRKKGNSSWSLKYTVQEVIQPLLGGPPPTIMRTEESEMHEAMVEWSMEMYNSSGQCTNGTSSHARLKFTQDHLIKEMTFLAGSLCFSLDNIAFEVESRTQCSGTDSPDGPISQMDGEVQILPQDHMDIQPTCGSSAIQLSSLSQFDTFSAAVACPNPSSWGGLSLPYKCNELTMDIQQLNQLTKREIQPAKTSLTFASLPFDEDAQYSEYTSTCSSAYSSAPSSPMTPFSGCEDERMSLPSDDIAGCSAVPLQNDSHTQTVLESAEMNFRHNSGSVMKRAFATDFSKVQQTGFFSAEQPLELPVTSYMG